MAYANDERFTGRKVRLCDRYYVNDNVSELRNAIRKINCGIGSWESRLEIFRWFNVAEKFVVFYLSRHIVFWKINMIKL